MGPLVGGRRGARRAEVEEEVVAPVEGGALLDAEAGAIALVGVRRVGVPLLGFEGQLGEEGAPRGAGTAEEV